MSIKSTNHVKGGATQQVGQTLPNPHTVEVRQHYNTWLRLPLSEIRREIFNSSSDPDISFTTLFSREIAMRNRIDPILPTIIHHAFENIPRPDPTPLKHDQELFIYI